MKIAVVILINLFFGILGFYYKNKFKREKEYLDLIQDFIHEYETNITLFKNNIHEIINNYIIMQKNKNAKQDKLFLKTNNNYRINAEILVNEVSNKKTQKTIIKYFENIGKSEYLEEKEKLQSFKIVIKNEIEIQEKLYKSKGELFFKIMISMGLILSIIVW